MVVFGGVFCFGSVPYKIIFVGNRLYFRFIKKVCFEYFFMVKCVWEILNDIIRNCRDHKTPSKLRIEGFFMGFVILPSFIRLFNLPKNMHTSDEGNENNVLGLPYKLAKVSSGKKPYLVFYIWNENTEKLERIRWEPPKGGNAKTWFKERIKIINEHLVAGVRILKIKKIVIVKKPQVYTVLEALDEITKIRINNNVIGEMSQGRQKSFLNVFSKYLKNENLDTLLITEIKRIHIITFIDKIVGKNSTKIII